ncbi:hypothetical protein D3C76_744910 [compost metagenome]
MTVDMVLMNRLRDKGTCLLVGLIIEPRSFLSEVLDQIVINQPMLGRDFSSRISGGAVQNASCLQNTYLDSGLYQQISGSYTRDPGTDDSDLGFNIFVELGERG